MSFRLVPKSVTLNDLERRNGVILRYFSEFGQLPGALRVDVRYLISWWVLGIFATTATANGVAATMGTFVVIIFVVVECSGNAENAKESYNSCNTLMKILIWLHFWCMFGVILSYMRFLFTVSDNNHVDVKVSPLQSNDPSFVRRYESTWCFLLQWLV